MRSIEAAQLKDLLRTHGCVVWGTGFVARMLHRALEDAGLWEQVLWCVVSHPQEGISFFGKDVRDPASLAERDVATPVLVAVHEALLAELTPMLDAWCPDWIWVHPLMSQLLCGPVVAHRRVPVRKLVQVQGRDQYWLAVRLLALEDTAAGRAVYLKTQALHCEPATALKRYEQLEDLARSFEERGFDETHPLIVDGDGHVVEGLHRLACAWHYGFYDVPCLVVASADAFFELVGEANRLPIPQLDRAGLTAEERVALARVQERLHARDPLVSIILPAYNVEGYLDICMKTVVAQTMGDFEAILVNDGSTDGTLAACEAWRSRDARVRVIDKSNGGVSSARNAGMDAARGRWLAFVDPDDWLEPTYLETLLSEAARTGADRVECDLWRYSDRTGNETQRACGGRMGVPYTREEQMRYGPTASYKALTRREVWERGGVRFPDCPYESPAVYALVVALARKLAYVPQPLYHYRRFRANSLVETAYAANGGAQRKPLGVEAMEELVAGFDRCGLLDQYRNVLPGVVTYRLSDMLAMYHHRMEPAVFDELVTSYRDVVRRLLGERYASPYVMLGGYNLNRLLLDLDLLQDPRLRLNFSSVVALVDAPLEREVTHTNRYREMMLQRECTRDIWHLLAREQPRYLFWDLMEERHDMGVLDGRLVTLSDAFAGSSLAGQEERRVSRNSDACRALWERSADAFLARVREVSPQTKVVVVESRLAERVGSPRDTRPFENVGTIRTTNDILDSYYRFLRECHPELVFVSTEGLESYYTDEYHEYGVVPEHLNALVNQQIARRIKEEIGI